MIFIHSFTKVTHTPTHTLIQCICMYVDIQNSHWPVFQDGCESREKVLDGWGHLSHSNHIHNCLKTKEKHIKQSPINGTVQSVDLLGSCFEHLIPFMFLSPFSFLLSLPPPSLPPSPSSLPPPLSSSPSPSSLPLSLPLPLPHPLSPMEVVLTFSPPRMLPRTSGYSSPRYSYSTTPRWPSSFSWRTNQATGYDHVIVMLHQKGGRFASLSLPASYTKHHPATNYLLSSYFERLYLYVSSLDF